jgi:hypothetical protein
MAWLREPVERLASHYHYWKRNPDRQNPTCRRLIEEDLTLEAFAALPEMRDVQARFLGAVPVSRLDFVGLTERYDDSLELFRRAFYPELALDTERHNANPERSADGYDLEDETRTALARLNERDTRLYAEAEVRFAELLAEHGVGMP